MTDPLPIEPRVCEYCGLTQCAPRSCCKPGRIHDQAMRLIDGAAHKDEPWDSPHNARLRSAGDVISVSEAELWLLRAELDW